MAEYIERDTVLKKFDVRKKLLDARLCECKPCDPSYNMYAHQICELIEARGFVSSAPATEVAPVVRGQWINQSEPHCDNNVTASCSRCLHTDTHAVGTEVPFCWFCGAKMDREE